MIRPLFLSAIIAFALGAQQDAIVIRGARVFDGTGAPARAADVLLRGGRIEAVAANLPVPSGARVVDATGETLLPGLFDLHTHLAASAATGVAGDFFKNAKAYLACGITTVNDFAEYSEMFEPLRRLLASGEFPGPRVNFASRMSTTGGHGTEGGWGDFMTLEANTPEQAHARVRAVLAAHPDVVKVFTDGWRYNAAPDLSSMNLETLSAIVDDVHAAGLRVFTHTVTLRGAKIAARAGVDVLAHGIGDAAVDAELIELMKAKGTAYASTLAVYESHQLSPLPPRALLVMAPDVRGAFGGREPAAESAARKQRWQSLTANVKQLFDAGVPVAAGTDAGMAGTFHGYASLHELELMVAAGLTPAQAIVAATATSARALGVDARRGTIAPGKDADLVLIDGAPDRDIADIEKTARVFLGGREFDPKTLASSIQAAEPTALPVRPLPALIDDMERADGRTALGTLRVNSTDSGIDHSTMLWTPVARGGGHSLLVAARFAAKDRPYVRLELPLTPGAVEPAGASAYAGVEFEVRGDAAARLLLYAKAGRAGAASATFTPSAAWQTMRIPFVNLGAVRVLAFELSGAPESTGWVELDNIRFYSPEGDR